MNGGNDITHPRGRKRAGSNGRRQQHVEQPPPPPRLSLSLCFSHSPRVSLAPQAVNFWQVLVMNDEHTERRHLLYFLLGWGLPALVIVLLVIVLLGGLNWRDRQSTRLNSSHL